MPSCSKSISDRLANNTINSLIFLENGIINNILFLGLNNVLLRLDLQNNDTLRFNLSLNNTSTINVLVSIYKLNLNTNTFSLIGSITTNDVFTSFTKALLQGEYVICIYAKNTASYTGTIQAIFSNFIPQARLSCNFYYGFNVLSNLTKPIITSPCTHPLYYELVDGVLPEGITLLSTGILQGILPNLDCMPSNNDLSPSSNWFNQLQSGISYPWGRAWRFKIRVSILGQPDIFKEQWLSIRVYNNYDLENKNFKSLLPLQNYYDIVIEQENDIIKLPDTLCETCNIIDNITVIDNNDTEILYPITDISYIKLPNQLLNIIDVMSWYNNTNLNEYLIQYNDLETKNFINKLKTDLVFKRILVKLGKEVQSENIDFSNMNYSITNNNGFIILETNIQTHDIHNINRNNTDLDVNYIANKDDINSSLNMQFVGWYGFTLNW